MIEMIKRIQIISSNTFYPYFNQALEKYLFDSMDSETVILFLWQNERSVSFGCSQRLKEDTSALYFIEEGGFPVRRLSEGRTVFQDKGDLNYSFLAKKDLFDMEKQFQILTDACRRIGLNTENPDSSGLTIDGQPFSFSTSYVSGIRSLHHGTMKLTACCSSVTAETMENSLLQAFENQYGLSAEPISAEALDFAVITSYEKIFRDDSWINGQE